ncbi:YdcF family protein [Methylocystis sp.]|uniref:YdcF family protein n=1 Tax=Methylocystis sp. TaxID=1911079 RepID=UPI003DA4E78B
MVTFAGACLFCTLLALLVARKPVLGGAVQVWLMEWRTTLEARFQTPCLHAGGDVTGIVVLGGSLERVQAAADLATTWPNARLIFSGPRFNEIAVVRQLPLPIGRYVIDNRPRDTFENATYSKELAAPRAGERWLLVTSALHMPRAMGAFRAQDFYVDPAPVDDALPQPTITAPVILHELLGLVYYRLSGRSRVLFPGPSGKGNPCQPETSAHIR